MLSKVFIAFGAVCAFAAPAAAQSFDAEITCGDVWQQGDSVPFAVRFEENANLQHMIHLTVTITRPDGISNVILMDTIGLDRNQDREFKRTVRLGNNAPIGNYDVRIDADDTTQFVSDTCSFDVI